MEVVESAELRGSAMLIMSCFLLSEGPSHETSVLYRTQLQHSAGAGASSACTGPAGAVGILPTLGNAPSHWHLAERCRHIQVTLHGASAGLAGFIQLGLAQHLLGWIWAGLCRATCALVLAGLVVLLRKIQRSSKVICSLPVCVQQGLMAAAVLGLQ